MAERIETTYKELVITYSEWTNKWTLLDGESTVEENMDSLKLAKESADKYLKKLKATTVKVPIIWRNRYAGPNKDDRRGYATSMDGEGRAWIVTDGRRHKENVSEIFLDTIENCNLLEEAAAAAKLAFELNAKVVRLSARDFKAKPIEEGV